MIQLCDYELKILRECVGELPVSRWGAAVSAAVETLQGYGYIERNGQVTMAGALYLDTLKLAEMVPDFGVDTVDLERAQAGVKHDTGKLPLHLLPPDALEAITEILDFGQQKYGPRNWEKGMAWGRLYRAALGHLFAWWMRRGNDPETGKSHLAHACCCVLFMLTYEVRGVGEDDRPGVDTDSVAKPQN